MATTDHPDLVLKRLLAAPGLRANVKIKLRQIHKLCKSRFARGEQDFGPNELAKAVSAAGILSHSGYLNVGNGNYHQIGHAWQALADTVHLKLDPLAAPDHPDSVLSRLLAEDKRRASSLAALRKLHQICRARFDRGEQNFTVAAVKREAAGNGLKSVERYEELLLSWQSLASQRGPVPHPSHDDDHPEAVATAQIRSPTLRINDVQRLEGIQAVCRQRFENGEYDFGPNAMAKALIAAGVFTNESAIVNRLNTVHRYRAILVAWQRKADALWISADGNLPLHHPDSVYRRVRAKNVRADRLRVLLGIHRVCHLHHKAGNRDFSHKTIGALCAGQGVFPKNHLKRSTREDDKILIAAWAEFARPWLAEDGPPPDLIQPRRQKSRDISLAYIRRDHPDLEEWRALAEHWLGTIKTGLASRISATTTLFDHYLTRSDVPKRPADLLRRGCQAPSIASIESMGLSNVTRSNHLSEFFEWVLVRNFSLEADDGELVVSPAFRNPLQRATGSGSNLNSQSVYSPLPYGYIHELRRMLAEGPTFRDWKFAQNGLGAAFGQTGAPSRDWINVSRSQIDFDDPDCVWRTRPLKRGFSKPITVYQMWSPVRWVGLLIKLLLPLRTAQVRWLDSGESDTWKYVNGDWVQNDHPLAALSPGALWQQGVLRRSPDPAKGGDPATVLYVSTNKTADQKKSGPHKGYVLPWHKGTDPVDDAYYWLEKLRNWQSKYNPIRRRTSWSELDGRHVAAKSRKQLESYPDTCFLFRMAEVEGDERMLPLKLGVMDTAWCRLLKELQDRLAKRGETHPGGSPITFVQRDNQGRYTRNDFPLHSLRVSLITALALEGEVPFAILQKLVGHSRLLMTLYYTKPGYEHISRKLEEAAALLDSKKDASIFEFLLNSEHAHLVNTAISNNAATLATAIPRHPSERNAAGWMLMHIGLCLVGGNVSELEDSKAIGGCYNGGPDLGTHSVPVHGPVPGGSRNCIRCRWFVTEPHYLPALVANFNTLAYHFDEARNNSMESERVLQTLRRKKAEVEAHGQEPFMDHKDLRQAERIWESAMKRFSDLSEDLVACWRLIDRCKHILDQAPSEGLQLVLQGAASDVQAVFEETESELLQLCGVCESVALYPDLDPGKAVIRRSQLLDSALYNDGLPPMFLKLGEAEQLKVGNALIRRLARIASPDNLFVGKRKVIEIIDAGGSLSESLGIDLAKTLPELYDNANEPRRTVIKLVAA